MLQKQIKKVKNSIVAIGFNPNPNQITILGSGFSVSDDGRIITAAHLYNQLTDEQKRNLRANVIIKRESNELETYKWIPIKFINKNNMDDLAIFQLAEYKDTLLTKLELGDSDKVELGQDVYFIGFPYAAQLMNDGFGITLIANKGIISNIKRDGVNFEHKRNFIIIDAISNPGNSGCPLIDLKTNKVIGVMAISFGIPLPIKSDPVIREPMHICAARPSNLVKDLLNKQSINL